MAYIEGIVSREQLEELRAAGYDIVHSLDKGQDDFEVEVFVTCDVNDLLSPPLCANCGAYMEHRYYPDQEGGTMMYVCPECDRQERIVVDSEGR